MIEVVPMNSVSLSDLKCDQCERIDATKNFYCCSKCEETRVCKTCIDKIDQEKNIHCIYCEAVIDDQNNVVKEKDMSLMLKFIKLLAETPKCTQHNKPFGEMYCVDCKIRICENCIFSTLHKTHDIHAFSQYFGELKQEAETYEKDLKNQVKRYNIQMSYFKTYHESLLEQLKTEFETPIEEVIDQLKTEVISETNSFIDSFAIKGESVSTVEKNLQKREELIEELELLLQNNIGAESMTKLKEFVTKMKENMILEQGACETSDEYSETLFSKIMEEYKSTKQITEYFLQVLKTHLMSVVKASVENVFSSVDCYQEFKNQFVNLPKTNPEHYVSQIKQKMDEMNDQLAASDSEQDMNAAVVPNDEISLDIEQMLDEVEDSDEGSLTSTKEVSPEDTKNCVEDESQTRIDDWLQLPNSDCEDECLQDPECDRSVEGAISQAIFQEEGDEADNESGKNLEEDQDYDAEGEEYESESEEDESEGDYDDEQSITESEEDEEIFITQEKNDLIEENKSIAPQEDRELVESDTASNELNMIPQTNDSEEISDKISKDQESEENNEDRECTALDLTIPTPLPSSAELQKDMTLSRGRSNSCGEMVKATEDTTPTEKKNIPFKNLIIQLEEKENEFLSEEYKKIFGEEYDIMQQEILKQKAKEDAILNKIQSSVSWDDEADNIDYHGY